MDVRWRLEGPDGGRTLRFTWTERGGPRVIAPETPGFGSTILTSLTPRAMGGSASLVFDAEGLAWALNAPLSDGTPSDQADHPRLKRAENPGDIALGKGFSTTATAP